MDENRQVLVLEDEALLRRCLTRLLERSGHRVFPAGTIQEAREFLLTETVDAAILDVGLPDGNGLDLLDLTHVDRSLVVSAEVSEERLEKSGVTYFQRKPLDLACVASQIDDFVTARD